MFKILTEIGGQKRLAKPKYSATTTDQDPVK